MPARSCPLEAPPRAQHLRGQICWATWKRKRQTHAATNWTTPKTASPTTLGEHDSLAQRGCTNEPAEWNIICLRKDRPNPRARWSALTSASTIDVRLFSSDHAAEWATWKPPNEGLQIISFKIMSEGRCRLSKGFLKADQTYFWKEKEAAVSISLLWVNILLFLYHQSPYHSSVL